MHGQSVRIHRHDRFNKRWYLSEPRCHHSVRRDGRQRPGSSVSERHGISQETTRGVGGQIPPRVTEKAVRSTRD